MKEHPQALVTVIALCYNQAPFVLESLESIRGQTYKNIQLIVTDDHSQDGSTEIIKKWIADNKIECAFITHGQNRGMCRTLNEALSHAKGKYVSLIAADDAWMPDKIERQVDKMEELPEDVGVVFSDVMVVDGKGKVVSPNYYPSFYKVPKGDIFDTLIKENPVSASSLIRRSCYEKVGLYDERLLYEDWDMWLRISQHYKFIFLPGISARYRVITDSAWHNVSASKDFPLTQFLIFSKCLAYCRLDETRKKVIVNTVYEYARTLYQNGHDKRTYCLWQLVKYTRSPSALMMLIFSTIGIPYSLFNRAYRRLADMKKCVSKYLFLLFPLVSLLFFTAGGETKVVDEHIYLVPAGEVDRHVIEEIKNRLPGSLPMSAKAAIDPQKEISQAAYDPSRKQYNAEALLDNIFRQVTVDTVNERALIIVDVDLYAQDLNFVFGLADEKRGIAIISLKRLRDEFYGLKPDYKLFLERVLKEAIHELGHSWGLSHCSNPRCVMYFSSSLADTDRKRDTFCRACRDLLLRRYSKPIFNSSFNPLK